MITQIAGTNIKGQTFSHSVGKVTVFHGENAAGKSARLDAVRLALWGHVPELGKQVSSTALLSSGDRMEAGMEFNGQSFKRTWLCRTSGARQELTGEPPDLPYVLLSPSEFFDQSSERRLQYVFSRIPIDGAKYGQATVVARMKRIRCEDHTARKEVALQNLVAEITAPDRPADAWVGGLIEKFEELVKGYRQAVDRLRKAHEAQVQTAGEPVDGRQAEEDYKQLTQEVVALRQSKADAEREIASVEAQEDQATSLKSKLVSLEVSAAAVNLCKESIAKLQSELTAPVDTSALQSELAEINADIAKLAAMKDTVALESRIAEVKVAIESTDELSKKTDGLAWTRGVRTENFIAAKRAADLAALAEQQAAGMVCDKCGSGLAVIAASNRREADALLAVAEQHLKSAKAAADEAAQAGVRLTALREELDSLGKKVLAAEQAGLGYVAKLGQRDEVSEKLGVAAAAARAYTAAMKKLAALEAEMAGYNSKREQHKLVSAQLAGIKPGDTTGYRLAIADADERLPGLLERAAAAEQLWKKAMGQQQQQAALRKLLSEVTEAEAALEVGKLVIAELKAIRNEMIETSVAPLMDRANLIAGAVLKTVLKFNGGDIGRFDHAGRWVGWQTFSGTEQAVTFAAFAFALATESPFKFVFLDEMGRLSVANKQRLVSAMVKLVASGVLHQFFCVDTTPEPYMLPGVTLIKV